jgi:DNA-binding SARP family transcriptional activator
VTEFGILGPLEVRRGDEEVELGGRNQRAVLAMLLLHANRVVSIEHLSEELYAGDPPVTAVTQVHRQVSELRKVVGQATVETRPPGYVVRVADGALDLHRFERLTATAVDALADGEAQSALQSLDEALALWRGPALGDLGYEQFAQGPIARLEELRLAAVERRLEAQMALGRHPDVIAELRELTVSHPLRERFRELLMRALYAAGRQVEALEVYRATRAELVSAYGVEPGVALQQLEQAILQQDPELAPSRALGVVLLAARKPVRLDGLLGAAEALASRPDRELLVSLLVDDEAALQDASTVLYDVRERLGSRGRAAAFVSSGRGNDILHLTRSHDPELVLVEGGPDDLSAPGSELAAVLESSPADVAVMFAPPLARTDGEGVLVPFGGGEHDWAAVELGAWLATANAEPLRLVGARAGAQPGDRDASRLLADASLAVQRLVGIAAEPLLVDPTAGGLLDAVAGARAVVIGLSPRWRQEGLGEARRALVADPACPVLVVHRGSRPGGIAPREAATRFTWSLGG